MVFFSSLFQDLATGKTIGIAKEQGGLYYFQHEDKKYARLHAHTSSKVVNLGHPLRYGFNTDVLVILPLVP